MPDSTAKPKATKRKPSKARSASKAATGSKATARAKAGASKRKAGGARKASTKARASALPRDALKSLEEGQHAALEAVRKFVETVDNALPGEGRARRQEIVDSALELAERLVHTEYDLLRRLLQSAGRLGDTGKR
jgi:flagellar biosynthesis/type III secretory pathway protein FliH